MTLFLKGSEGALGSNGQRVGDIPSSVWRLDHETGRVTPMPEKEGAGGPQPLGLAC